MADVGVAVMRAGGIVPLILLARDGAPPAQRSALLALAAFQIPLARDCAFPIPALVRGTRARGRYSADDGTCSRQQPH